jgi:hypothetical protein
MLQIPDGQHKPITLPPSRNIGLNIPYSEDWPNSCEVVLD